ncbi:MAG: hypothetical protein M3220_06015 [Chloroflexota bacterium]|nr:hypothetical protein [Chloroflexota bacterium]
MEERIEDGSQWALLEVAGRAARQVYHKIEGQPKETAISIIERTLYYAMLEAIEVVQKKANN